MLWNGKSSELMTNDLSILVWRHLPSELTSPVKWSPRTPLVTDALTMHLNLVQVITENSAVSLGFWRKKVIRISKPHWLYRGQMCAMYWINHVAYCTCCPDNLSCEGLSSYPQYQFSVFSEAEGVSLRYLVPQVQQIMARVLQQNPCSSGVGVTKAPFVNFSISKNSDLTKVPVRFFESHSYLSAVTAAELRRHLSDINEIFND